VKPTDIIESGAVIEGRYRYSLWRFWDKALSPLVWVMLNPSTADETQNDPTIRRCIGFARELGHGGIVVVNLFALRSTSPAALAADIGAGQDPIGPKNNEHIASQVRAASRVICAWGPNGMLKDRDKAVFRLLQECSEKVECLGLTKTTACPRHPLYVMGGTVPIPFEGRK